MRFLKRFAGMLGFGPHNDAHESKDEDDDDNNNHDHNSDDIRRNRAYIDPIPAGPRKGFSVPVQVPVERHAVGPILVPCNGDGGVQGLRWYANCLKTDEDGDVADEFLYEVPTDTSPMAMMQDQGKPLPRFRVKHNARHAKVKKQALTPDGKLQHFVDCQGRLQWV